MTIAPFKPAERVLFKLLASAYGSTKVGGGGDDLDLVNLPFFARIEQSGGRADIFEGEFVIDIDVFSFDDMEAWSKALDIEALLINSPHVVPYSVGQFVIIDRVFENVGPNLGPWEDESVTRVMATYVLTIRRPKAI